jgi:hypothetical protein
VSRPVIKALRPHKLTQKQRAFVDFILAGLSPSEAAEQSGYGTGDAPTYNTHKAASVLLAKPWIATAIRDGKQRQRDERSAIRPELSRSEVISDLDDIARAATEAGPGAWQTTALLKVAELKAKLLGLFEERQQVVAAAVTGVQTDITVNFVHAPQSSLPEPLSRGQLIEAVDAATGDSGNQAEVARWNSEDSPPATSPSPALRYLDASCERHGGYRAERVRVRGSAIDAWSCCPQCKTESEDYERRLGGLAPGTPEWSGRRR